MRSDVKGRRSARKAVGRLGQASTGLLLALALGACTTTEGTNALADFGTFEREVMNSTLIGLGVIDDVDKPEPTTRRGPLVLPKKGGALPTPQDEESRVALLPEDSANVRIDATGLSEEDIRRLRNARVVDARTLSGRPLTPEETRMLTARMTAARVQTGPRPLYLPPEEYFTTVKGRDLVCLAGNGDLVPLDDPACPAEVRRALLAQN